MRPNILGHRLTSMAVWTPFAKPMADARRDVLGLSGRSTAAAGQPSLYAISPHVLTVPGSPNHTTGYWFPTDDLAWRPSAALEEFLSRGPAVSIGFGSMAGKDAAQLTGTVLAAIRLVGVRAVLLSGWGGLADAAHGDDVLAQKSVPHEWLFPRMSAVVHHGGAGTTAAGLRAGVPSIVVPFTVDQPFWGSRIVDLGVGPAPIPQRRLTAPRLAQALVAALGDDFMRHRASELGDSIRAEDGLTTAIEVYERTVHSSTR
ncbi:glycosyltransferase [Cryobacterium sp. PH31-AA6]|uniref:glycosyltransferase n=1 Tax=Cryobacterium sp. PH31-AA6 TaxID=3046205 RepID=UPI0024B88A19|nr:glycosyltransferase [Cryobacterium sp. PH31-AA6]MDJ0324230.1 glycosyltransferase [Cryobacterium sp. PH31-AA6]